MNDPYNLSMPLVNEDSDFAELAVLNADGLVGISEDLNPELVLSAYASGAFPWYKFLKVYWWHSPDPRMVLFPEQLKVSKSMRQVIRKECFKVTANQAFEAVMDKCAKVPRREQEGTWITPEFKQVYSELHEKGFAQSIEVWQDDLLVGGLYGIKLGDNFFGESMFSEESNASKRAFIALAQGELLDRPKIIDCQVYTNHLSSMGAALIERAEFLKIIKAQG